MSEFWKKADRCGFSPEAQPDINAINLSISRPATDFRTPKLGFVRQRSAGDFCMESLESGAWAHGISIKPQNPFPGSYQPSTFRVAELR